MASIEGPGHVLPDDQSVAYHVPWSFRTAAYYQPRADAALPHLTVPFPNLHPFAAELRKWMLREPAQLPVLESDATSGVNPYAQHASVLIAEYQRVTNESAMLRETGGLLDPYELELKRIRIFSELVLYTARISEALIKQLLFCTDFPHGWYRKAPLGLLLSRRCLRCPQPGSAAHRVSLLGSLAHRYGFCLAYEKCLEQDLPWLKQLRDRNATHAAIWDFRIPTSPEIPLNKLKTDALTIGERFLHMLRHIADVEARIIFELQALSRKFPFGPLGSNLVSTFHFETRARRLIRILRRRASVLNQGPRAVGGKRGRR